MDLIAYSMSKAYTDQEANKPIASARISFMAPGKNLFDKSKATQGYYVSPTTGALVANAGYYASDFIPVEPNTQYIRSLDSYMAFYTSGKVVCSPVAGQTSGAGKGFTTPADCAYVRTSIVVAEINTFQLEKGTVSTPYEPYKLLISTDVIRPITTNEIADRAVTAAKVDFLSYTKNLFDKSKATQGYYVNSVYGTLSANASYWASDWIPVQPNTKYTRSYDSYTAFYDANKLFISGHDANTGKTVTTPANCYFMRVTAHNDVVDRFQCEQGNVETPWEPYQLTLAPANAPRPANRASKIVLPPKIYGVVGKETNVYFDNLIAGNADRYDWDVECAIGKQQDERFTVIPASEGTSSLKILAFEDAEYVVGAGNASLVVSSTATGAGVNLKVLAIGDSTTYSGYWTGELLNLFGASEPMDITLIGTIGTAPNVFEGRQGWTIAKYYNDPASPFVFSGAFNFSQYMSTNGFPGVDIILIHLGINDLISSGAYVSDPQLLALTPTMITNLENMIANFKVYNPEVKVGLMLTIPPARHQDAWGYDYNTGHNRWRYKRSLMMWVEQMITSFANRESEGIHLVPVNVNLDTEHNMSYDVATPWNSRTSETVARQKSGVHPTEAGYYQMADMVYYWLKSLQP
jgi:lysophospholipase L1-like esterase